MKNKFFYVMVLVTLVSGCSRNTKPEDPLLLPPNFNEIPDLNNPTPEKPQTSSPDVEELRNLLLKSQ